MINWNLCSVRTSLIFYLGIGKVYSFPEYNRLLCEYLQGVKVLLFLSMPDAALVRYS